MLYFDTCFLVPYFASEATSASIEAFFAKPPAGGLAISSWTESEFYGALGIKIRTSQITEPVSLLAQTRFEQIRTEFFELWHVTRDDYLLAKEYLKSWKVGLRSGDALHLAIAHNHKASCFYTLDERLLKAARHFKIPAKSL